MEQKIVFVHIRYLQQQLDVNESSSRPSLAFPLGIALLLIVIFSLSGIFACCYHWDKLRNLHRRRGRHPHLSDHPSSSKSTRPSTELGKQEVDADSVTAVIMPGDEIAKFIALPCPCQPYRPPQQLSKPTNTIPTYFTVPLYI